MAFFQKIMSYVVNNLLVESLAKRHALITRLLRR